MPVTGVYSGSGETQIFTALVGGSLGFVPEFSTQDSAFSFQDDGERSRIFGLRHQDEVS